MDLKCLHKGHKFYISQAGLGVIWQRHKSIIQIITMIKSIQDD